jgi:hypothetical protein
MTTIDLEVTMNESADLSGTMRAGPRARPGTDGNGPAKVPFRS